MPDDADDHSENAPTERTADPVQRVREKADEMRLHAEIAAVFEGVRKFDAAMRPGLSAEVARGVQRGVGKLDKQRSPESPLLPSSAVEDAAAVLRLTDEHGLSTNDYHVYRRPGEAMLVRWLAGDEVAAFYERLQAHFDAALAGLRDEQRQEQWRQDAATSKYLEALEGLDVSLADRWQRDAVRAGGAALSTQTADEMNIAFLCDHVMGVPAAEVVGPASAPPDEAEPAERDLAWFYKLFMLRGTVDGEERACFFTYLQKSDDFDFGE